MSLLVDTSVWSLAGPKNSDVLLHHFPVLACLQPDRHDHLEAAEVRNACRRRGVQIGTIDALLIQLCCRHDLTMLSTDKDFALAAKTIEFRLWSAS